MSIIYNALQKTQKNLGKKHNVRREKRWIDVTLLLVIVGLVIVNVVTYYPKLKKHFLTTAIIKPIKVAPVKTPNLVAVTPPSHLTAPAPKEIEYQGKLVLNGVFLSEQEKVALIDSQPMHVGDVVDGKKIISIEMNKVRLLDKDNIFILRTVA